MNDGLDTPVVWIVRSVDLSPRGESISARIELDCIGPDHTFGGLSLNELRQAMRNGVALIMTARDGSNRP